jgi:hypothetical protein
MPQFSKSCQHIAYHSIGFPKSFKFIQMHSTSFHISKVTEQTWRVQNCPTMVHVQAVGSVRLPFEIYATQAAGLPESVGGTTVRICSPEQMTKPHQIVDAPDAHEPPSLECWKYLLTKAPAGQGPTDLSSFRETCTAETQQVFNWGQGPGPQPPKGPPPAALSQALSSNTDTLLQQKEEASKKDAEAAERPTKMQKGPQPPKGPSPAAPSQASSSNTVAPDTLLQQREEGSNKDAEAEERPIKTKKLGREGSVAEMVPEEEVQNRRQSPVTPLGAPVTPEGLIDVSPSSAEMTCPLMVARVADEHAAKTAQLHSPDNWKDRIIFRRPIITHMSICVSVFAHRRALTSYNVPIACGCDSQQPPRHFR